ncbi:alpha/beta fold hydrolase [Streptomyces sp. SP18CS02]|uniref:alpha/beta fold hydrolase n=1 Tax=Streptomyces sp. SP18CS02 TaxID=3002531 RepID=UPI002E76C85D|nr:alpha/beta fold hydrolase [Streptomyces sp. SP18CS02]MEE1755184.1 alpha/beta fold hydrolase [Streptomyces sp. SP18CS02]
MDLIACDGEWLGHVLRDPGEDAPATVVVLHGAGNGSMERLLPLVDEFAARGCRVLAMDFSGHGTSTGELRESSLERRFAQAREVIDRLVPAQDPLTLVGFSMSGQTVADLARHYGGRVVALALCAPAVYAREAWPVRFGDGFTGIIREPGSWRRSGALDALREFEGVAVLVVPGTDEVIPPAVTEAVEDALSVRSHYRRLPLERAGHRLGLWFRDEAEDRRRFVDTVLAPSRTPGWVAKQLASGGQAREAGRLRGGWTSQMRRLRVEEKGGEREVVLRSFVKPFYRRHAPGLLAREAAVLDLLAGTDVPAATCLGVDAAGEHCDDPSLLMSLLPGSVRVDTEDVDTRVELLARQLVGIHAVTVAEGARPRPYQAWTSPERVRVPRDTGRPELWARAVRVIGRPAPSYEGCFLHRDFHPGNVLFQASGSDAADTGTGAGTRAGSGGGLRISGVVDWVETSWGPADLDVAHCSTALALLYGVECGLRFGERYVAHGGVLSADPGARLYWRLLDALAFAPDAEKVAGPWRELGRTDLTPELLAARLEAYIEAVLGAPGAGTP